jgi:outer membrane receptor protein involved in Fe transport
MKIQTYRTLLACGVVLAGTSLVREADAQTPTPAQTSTTQPEGTLEEVVVTGSLIRQPNITATSPLTTIDRADLEQQDAAEIQDVLLRSPEVYAGQNSMTGFTSNAGASTLSLRNLGSNRTLVLIDGQRLAPTDPSGYGAADISLIPSVLIQRVDIVTGGASAVYGGDALAGAVNFVIDRLDGFRADITGGDYQHSNGDTFLRNLESSQGFATAPSSVWNGGHVDVNFARGITSDDGNTHIQAYLGYRRQEPISVNNYDFSGCNLANAGSSATCTSSGFTQAAQFYAVNGTANNYILDQATGGLRPIQPTDVSTAQNGYLLTDSTRYLAGFMADSKISANVKLYSSFMYMKNTSSQVVTPSELIGEPLTLSCNNGMLTSQELSTFCGGSTAGTFTSNITRKNTEGQPRTLLNNTDEFRVTGGMDAEVSDFHVVVHGQYTRALAAITYANDLSVSHLNSALNGCPAGSPGGCVPYNIFVPGGVTSPALAFVQASGTEDTLITEKLVSATVDGDLAKYGIKSPWAQPGVGIALGVDYRDEEYSAQPDYELSSGDLETFGAFSPIAGGFKIREIYGETRVPLITDRPGVRDLSVGSAFRVSNYSTFGSTPTYAFNVDYAPTEDVRFRSSYNRAIREPSLQELYSPQGTGYANYQMDDCEGATPIWTQQQCANTGVSAAEYGQIIAAPPGLYHNGSYGGNPELGPERADTYSAGIVVTPTALRDLTVTVDWFDITINDTITAPPPQTVLDLCATTGSSLYCSLVHRAPGTGSLWLSNAGYITGTLLNTGTQKQDGFDIKSTYLLPLGGFGRLGFNFAGTYVYTQSIEVVSGAPAQACQGYYGATCGQPTPRWRNTLTSNWSTPWKFDVTLAWRFLSGVNSDQPDTPAFSEHISSESYFDLSTAYHIAPGCALRLGVNNLFDKDPPLVAGANLGSGGTYNTFPSTYDSFGRTLYAKFSLNL